MRILIGGLTVILALIMGGCTTLDNAGKAGSSVVNSGANLVAYTGSAVGKTVESGVGYLTGQPASYKHMNSNSNVVYHNGHKYKIVNGKYVLVR